MSAIVAAAVGVLIRPRHYTHVDVGSRVVRIIRNGSVTRELPLSQLAPLEVHEFVPVKETNFSVRYGVRSRPFPDVQFGDDAVQSKALRRLATVGERLGLSTTAAVVSSADLTPDGEAKWIESDPV